MTMHMAGSKIPDRWFKNASLFDAHFGCDCWENLSYGQRIIRRAGEGPCLAFFNSKPGVSESIEIMAALPMLWINEAMTPAASLME